MTRLINTNEGVWSAELTLKAPNTTIAEFANTADADENNEPSHLNPQCLPSSL